MRRTVSSHLLTLLPITTIPIQHVFLGSPPPGSWVDVLVTLWAIVPLAVVLLVGPAAFIKNPRRNH